MPIRSRVMVVLLGGAAGVLTGMVGSLVTSLLQRLAAHLRQVQRSRRGQPPLADAGWQHYWPLFGMLGAIAGASWTWRLDGTWVTGALAGSAVPAVATFVYVVLAIVRLRR